MASDSAKGLGSTSSEIRPIGIAVISLFWLTGGLAFLAQAILATTSMGYLAYYFAQEGFLSLPVAWGLWKGKKWGWVLIITIASAGLLATPFELISMDADWQYHTLALNVTTIVLIYYMTRRSVETFFGVESLVAEFA